MKLYITDSGQIQILVGNEVNLIMYGIGLSNETEVKFTTSDGEFGTPCGLKVDETHINTVAFPVERSSSDGKEAHLTLPADALKYVPDARIFYPCLVSEKDDLHQGTKAGTQIHLFKRPIPVWFMVILICILLCLSGLFSGKRSISLQCALLQ